MREHDDELDRALFALPIPPAPHGMRESILATTIYAPALAMRFWETAAAGVLLAVATWLVLALAGGVNFGPALAWISQQFSDRELLLWMAFGGSTALGVSLLHPSPEPRPARLRVMR